MFVVVDIVVALVLAVVDYVYKRVGGEALAVVAPCRGEQRCCCDAAVVVVVAGDDY